MNIAQAAAALAQFEANALPLLERVDLSAVDRRLTELERELNEARALLERIDKRPLSRELHRAILFRTRSIERTLRGAACM